MKFISSSSTSNMNTLTICIFVLCAVLMPYQGAKAQFASGTLGVCSAPGGFACLTTGDIVTTTLGSFAPCVGGVQGGTTLCPLTAGVGAAKYICYPGGAEPGTDAGTPCGPDVIGPCLANGNEGIPGFCRSYTRCTAGVRTILGCPAGQEFNRITKTCVATALAGCSLPLPPPPPAPPAPIPPTGFCFPLKKEADPTSCRQYYLCTLFNARVRIACPANLFFDTTFNVCLPTKNCGVRPDIPVVAG